MRKKLSSLGFIYFSFTFIRKGYYLPHKFIGWILYLPEYFSHKRKLVHQANKDKIQLKFKRNFPVHYNRNTSLSINRHYWIQDIWALKKIETLIDENNSKGYKHLDIGSRVEGFLLGCLGKQNVDVYFGDINYPTVLGKIQESYTPKYFNCDLQNLKKGQLKEFKCVTSLHVIEHLGLGKYGDSIDYRGHLRVFEDMFLALGSNSRFITSTPISSTPGIIFDAGRHCNPEQILKVIHDTGWEIMEAIFIDDGWETHKISLDGKLPFKIDYGCLLLDLKKS